MFSRLVKIVTSVKVPLPLRLAAWYLLLSNLWSLVTSLVVTGGTVGWWDKGGVANLGLPPAPALPPDLASSNSLSNFLLLLPYALIVISLVGIVAATWLLQKKFEGWILTVILMVPIFISAVINFSHRIFPADTVGWSLLAAQVLVFVYLIASRRLFR